MTSTKRTRPAGYEDAVADDIQPDLRRRINQALQSRAWPLFLHGPVGTGKTCAAAVLFGAGWRDPMWWRADDLLCGMATGRTSGVPYGDRALSWSQFVYRVKHCGSLCLDDLGVRRPTEAMQQALFDLMEWRRGKPFVMTSNKSPEEIGALYDDRITSRIRAGSVIEVRGPDRRKAQGYRVLVTV